MLTPLPEALAARARDSLVSHMDIIRDIIRSMPLRAGLAGRTGALLRAMR